MVKVHTKIYYFLQTITLPLRLAHSFAALRMMFAVLNGLIPLFTILATSNFINSALNIKKTNSIDYFSIIILLAVISWTILQPNINNIIDIQLTFRFREKLITTFTQKKSKLKYYYIEDNDTLDLINRVTSKPEEKFLEMADVGCSAISYIFSICSVILLFFSVSKIICLIILSVSTPILYFAIKAGRKKYQIERETYNVKRQYEYLSEMLKSRDTLLERTLFGYSKKINSDFMRKFNEVYRLESSVLRKNFIRIKLIGISVSLVSVFSIFTLLRDTISKIISIGLFISLVNGLISLANDLAWNIPNVLDKMSNMAEYIKDYMQFINLEEEKGLTAFRLNKNANFEKLEFRNVSFKYPNSDEYILRNLSFTIEKNKIYAFVGKNGCGKTTITKLITGLYDNYEGDIFINGTSIKSMDKSELCCNFSGVFQDYAKYSITFEENVLISNPDSTAEDVENVINLCGLNDVMKSLPNGLKTNLGKIKDNSVDLSGGQWQRLAIARTALSTSPVKILDEPTSALDPIAESQVYRNFRNISEGNTTIMISHRLGSTRLADVIFVVSDGKIAEYGSHERLMSMNGLYSEMFNSQRSWYI